MRAIDADRLLKMMSHYFNPRSPCGERPKGGRWRECCWIFQSTLPVWGATNVGYLIPFYVDISIHAPRVGSDLIFFA